MVFKGATVIIDRIDFTSNHDVVKFKIEFFNDQVKDTAMNISFDLLQDVEKCQVTLKVNLPESEHDQSFKRDLFSSSFDLMKALNGPLGNVMMRVMLESFKKSMDFEARYPIKKVSITIFFEIFFN